MNKVPEQIPLQSSTLTVSSTSISLKSGTETKIDSVADHFFNVKHMTKEGHVIKIGQKKFEEMGRALWGKDSSFDQLSKTQRRFVTHILLNAKEQGAQSIDRAALFELAMRRKQNFTPDSVFSSFDPQNLNKTLLLDSRELKEIFTSIGIPKSQVEKLVQNFTPQQKYAGKGPNYNYIHTSWSALRDACANALQTSETESAFQAKREKSSKGNQKTLFFDHVQDALITKYLGSLQTIDQQKILTALDDPHICEMTQILFKPLQERQAITSKLDCAGDLLQAIKSRLSDTALPPTKKALFNALSEFAKAMQTSPLQLNTHVSNLKKTILKINPTVEAPHQPPPPLPVLPSTASSPSPLPQPPKSVAPPAPSPAPVVSIQSAPVDPNMENAETLKRNFTAWKTARKKQPPNEIDILNKLSILQKASSALHPQLKFFKGDVTTKDVSTHLNQVSRLLGTAQTACQEFIDAYFSQDAVLLQEKTNRLLKDMQNLLPASSFLTKINTMLLEYAMTLPEEQQTPFLSKLISSFSKPTTPS